MRDETTIEVQLTYERVPWWRALWRNRKRVPYDWAEHDPQLAKPDPGFRIKWPS